MSEVKCAYDFGDVKSEKLKDHLLNKCQDLIKAKDCLIDQKELYEEAILPIIENPTIINKLDGLAQLGFLNPDPARPGGFVEFIEDDAGFAGAANNVTPESAIKRIKEFYLPVKPDALQLKDIYDFYNNFYNTADPDEDAAAKARRKELKIERNDSSVKFLALLSRMGQQSISENDFLIKEDAKYGDNNSFTPEQLVLLQKLNKSK